MIRKRPGALINVTVIWTISAVADDLSCQVAYITDGDTFHCTGAKIVAICLLDYQDIAALMVQRAVASWASSGGI